MLRITKGRLTACAFLLGFVSILFISCGGNDVSLDRRHGPPFAPVQWFSGRHIGALLLRDRNGNLREFAQVTRDCKILTDTQRGSCTDSIQYGYEPARNHTAKLSWRLYHPSRDKAVLEYKDERGSFEAALEGRSAIASAMRLLEDASQKSAKCLIKFTMLPRNTKPASMLQSERCTYFGIFIGEIQILWKKEG